MQIAVQTKSKSLLGVSDLTLVATIKRGLIPALDSRSYETRLSLLTRTLNTLRVSSLEAEPTPLIADAIDRIRSLHSFRLAIVGQEPRQLLLAVTFDGGWESYMRRIWRDLGPLLDVIFCNCEGYLLSYDHSFAEYAGWVRSAQVSTEFFYNASSLTVNDLHYLRQSERQRSGATSQAGLPGKTALEQALPALTALYRLTDMYPPDTDDGACLLRAALNILKDLGDFVRDTQPSMAEYTPTERAATLWLAGAVGREFPPIKPAKWEPSKVQGGIIKKYKDVTHGCLLLIQFRDAAAAFELLDHLEPRITRASTQDKAPNPLVNLSFTFQGMQVAGVPNGTLDQLPFEFREGMAARAGILGDLRYNHPTCWPLPERNWAKTNKGEPDRVQLSSVHAIVHYAWRGTPSAKWEVLVGNNAHPLAKTVEDFENALGAKGVRILSVQAMQRFVEKNEVEPRDHFGFVDGISQPDPEAALVKKGAGNVVLGDLLLGYENSLSDPPLKGRLWDDSTFLVIRKLKQDVEALNEVLKQSTLKADDVKARLMGRDVNGKALIKSSTENDFNYDGDPDGVDCPLHSHVRRANPRSVRPDLIATPRIMRRGMSYGPRHSVGTEHEDRGLVFMAYNASIAEQFEVIQSWLSGGNSGGERTYSALHDPFLGVPQDDEPRTFAFKGVGGIEERLKFEPGKPLVRLEWGTYAFVPSIKALAELRELAQEAAEIEGSLPDGDKNKKGDSKNNKGDSENKRDDRRKIQRAVEAQKGAVAIGRLKLAEQALGFEAAKAQWKIALEDVGARMSGISQWIWTAVRELHGGALRTPYGVLVCSKKLVMQVFDDGGNVYTADGYADRMRESFGEIYLGMDRGTAYRDQATATNQAIQKITTQKGFDSAFKHTQAAVANLVGSLALGEEITVDVRDIIDDVLAGVSNEWFGLPDGGDVVAGGWHWHWRSGDPPTCPGHFHSPSRYMFQPNPGPEATKAGQQHGKALNTAVRAFVDSHRMIETAPKGPLARALFDAIPDDNERLARTLIGVMMGFLPTVDGNLRSALYEWVSDRSLWDHQIAYLADGGADSLARAESVLRAPLERTLLLRPVPELTWRTARVRHNLGPVDVNPGDRVVVSIVSATQECLIKDEVDLYPIFGGKRDDPKRDEATSATHACPGYKMAMGVMLGTLAGLMESARLSPTMSPMALRLSRRT